MRSFAILRTNVGLTTNVKVVVDSKYSLSLDSIDSVPELGFSKYKKFDFIKTNYYDEILPYFYDGIEAQIAFSIKYDDDSDTMTDNFSSQYDELYQYGARNIIDNKNYNEEYEYFAPLYIYKNKLPKNFIIFRVDNPGILNIDKTNVRSEVFKKFKTVSIFDLTKTSALGEWLDRNINDNAFYPKFPFEMNYTSLEFSQWNGIDFQSSGYVSKSQFLDDTLSEEKEIFELEKFIFDGYKNNKVIFSNIINFSFLFDDTPADPIKLNKWSINRYYGFYLDDMEFVSSISPYITPFLKSDVVIQDGNILYSEYGDPFKEGWSDSRPFYVEYKNEYYKVEKFTEIQKSSVKPVSSSAVKSIENNSSFSPKGNVVQVSTGQLVDVNNPISPTYISDVITETIVDKWRIISKVDLKDKQSLLNKNVGYINSNNLLINYDQSFVSIVDFELFDLWVIEIDGKYHNLTQNIDGNIQVYTDYSFEFFENDYTYYINKTDTSYTKKVSFLVDDKNTPKIFSIYRLKLTDIKDFDDRIVDTEPSKFEYEKYNEITETDETKLYLTNLNSNTNPMQLDDFRYKEKIVNIPVASEYTANQETFKVIENKLSPIWRKNPVYCRWAFEGSISANDYPYLLNNSDKFEDHNRTTNTFDPDPSRYERNLDYFYTVNSSTFSYLHHTLHVENNGPIGLSRFYFDFEKYLGTDEYYDGTVSKKYDFDYFSWFFDRKTTFLSNQIVKNARKYSLFSAGDSIIPNITLFRGIKFIISEVDSIKKNSSGQIDTINTKTSNKFDGYKFSILLSQKNNGMRWDVIDEWKMDKDYKQGDIVAYNDILYKAKKDSKTTMPTVNKNSLQIKALPYNLDDEWEYYIDSDMIMFNPLNSQNNYYQKGSDVLSKSVVYSSGDFYIFNGYDKPIDFWNPIIAYKTNSRLTRDTNGEISHIGYSEGSIVLYRGDYYKSTLDNNIYPPNYTQEFMNASNSWQKHWEKIDPVDANSTRWIEIQIWNPSTTYVPKTYIVHNEILYISNSLATTISSGEEPGVSNLWDRLYSFVADTGFNYQPNSNPLIRMNNEYYQIVSNQWESTLENGITIYINERWENVFVNIAINDNTISNLSNADRDDLYVSLNKKLTAANFISALNNLSNKHDFSDYISYVVIDTNGVTKSYNFENIESLPYILFAEKPERLDIKVNSLQIDQIEVSGLKPSKVLNDGKIESLNELNYFNKTHTATSIEQNLNSPIVGKNYHGGQNIVNDTIFRFGGNYVPLFYDIELFKKDNATSYNEMQIALNLEATQDLIFRFEKDGTSIEKTYMIYPGASYSYSTNTLFTVQNNPLVDIAAPTTSEIREIGSVATRTNTPATLAVQKNTPPYAWESGALEGDRYLVGSSPTGAWLGTYSMTGTSSVFYKRNSIATVTKGLLISGKFIAASSTASVPGWNISLGNPFLAWSYSPPNTNDVLYVSDMQSSIRYDGKKWISHNTTTKPAFNSNSDFVAPSFYDQITSIILGESIFEGIDFIFETLPASSEYAIDSIYSDFLEYDRTQTEIGALRNYNILSVKYKSSHGDLKLDISTIKPTLSMEMIDLSTGDIQISLGATGLNPPFQWSFTYSEATSYDTEEHVQSFTTSNNYSFTDSTGTNLVFDIKVMDSAGSISNTGYYIVNSGVPISIDGTFSYTTL